MLRRQHHDRLWLVTQPDHAQVSGYLAAHWGNDFFTRPGEFGQVEHAAALRAEVIFGIAHHDNGWWEWEATPKLDPDDHLPVGLGHVVQNRQDAMDRWRSGIPRFQTTHPLASLLISWHAYWLYADKVDPQADPTFLHPLFSTPSDPAQGDQRGEIEQFLAEVKALQRPLLTTLGDQPATRSWLSAESLHPHVRLVQALDGISLALCSSVVSSLEQDGEATSCVLPDLPRANWEDRVEVRMQQLEEFRFRFSPYPFDRDPLPVVMPARVFANHSSAQQLYPSNWYAQPVSLAEYTFTS